jgi:nicotinic acid mononucleotide adenylyltransferase
MIRDVVQAEGLEHKVCVLAVPRPDLYWPIAADMLPSNRVICLSRDSRDSDFEREKEERYSRLGERIYRFTGPTSRISGSKIRQCLERGERVDHLVPPAVLQRVCLPVVADGR